MADLNEVMELNKMKTIQGKLTAMLSMMLGMFVVQSACGQDATPFQPLSERTVDTNGATFLPDHSQYPSGPGSPPPVNSPGTTTDFQGLTDDNTLYPPDTHGAVGTN